MRERLQAGNGHRGEQESEAVAGLRRAARHRCERRQHADEEALKNGRDVKVREHAAFDTIRPGGPTRSSADVSVPRLAGFSLIT
jgi:hypothetical protein